ncbi:hypothetical protein Tco_1055431 [Tanacetum coccineum]|uniref:Uncharacterized protein n=1 Tax=Tanacetum coccineum TaxID=301880 RepID=A0ABQ5H0W2_9ASTR
MVLSLLSQMPPTSTPPTIEECLAKLADNIDKLELVGKRLAASTANFVSISTKTTSLNSTIIGTKSNDETTHKTPIVQNNQLETNTPTTIILPSSITPPLNNEEQDKTKASNPTHNMVQVQPANSLKPSGTAVCIISATNPSTNFHSTQNQSVGLPLQCLATTDIQAYCQRGLCFCCLKMSLVSHQCCPPTFVFLRIEPKPPWEPRDPRYKTMILEDKDRFQDGSIDTCMRSKTTILLITVAS